MKQGDRVCSKLPPRRAGVVTKVVHPTCVQVLWDGGITGIYSPGVLRIYYPLKERWG